MKDDDEPIDFSLLDPSHDSQRWSKGVESVVARALRALPPATLPQQLVAWFRPALAIAAATAALAWAGPAFNGLSATPTREEPAWAMAKWTMDEQAPSVWQAIAVLGESDAAR